MISLSAYDPNGPTLWVRDWVTLRPEADWAGADAGQPVPVKLTYREVGGGNRWVEWTDDLRSAVGRTFKVIGLDKYTRLPVIALAAGHYPLHPDWFDVATPVVDPAGAPCVCPIGPLMSAGCTCGRMARERAAR